MNMEKKQMKIETKRGNKMTTKEVAVLENEVTLMGKTFNVYGTMEEPLFRMCETFHLFRVEDANQMSELRSNQLIY